MEIAPQTIFEERGGDDSDSKGGEIELHTAAMKLGKTSKRNDVELVLDATELGAIQISRWLETSLFSTRCQTIQALELCTLLEDLNNLGGCFEYIYLPKCTGSRGDRSYVGYFTPRRATVVSENENGERVIG